LKEENVVLQIKEMGSCLGPKESDSLVPASRGKRSIKSGRRKQSGIEPPPVTEEGIAKAYYKDRSF